MLNDMFEIVKKHEKINKQIEYDYEESLESLMSQHENTAAKQQKINETKSHYKSAFMAERERYQKRNYFRMRENLNLLLKYKSRLNGIQWENHGRQKVLELRQIELQKIDHASAKIKEWDITYDNESFEQFKVLDSTLVNVISGNQTVIV